MVSMVRLERSASLQEITDSVGQLVQTLKAPHNRELRRALTACINRVVFRRLTPDDDAAQLQDLTEVQHMIGERIDRWAAELIQQGFQQGLQQQRLLNATAHFLRRLLVRRFGVLPLSVEAQINAAA